MLIKGIDTSTGDDVVVPFGIDLYFNFPNTIEQNQDVIKLVVNRPFVLPQNMVGSSFKCINPASAQSILSVKKDGVEVGTITFASGATDATFTLTSPVTFQTGNLLTVTYVSESGNIAGLYVTLATNRI